MTYNKIDASITPEIEENVIQKIKEAKDMMPFLITLSTGDRVRLSKLSRKHVDFVQKGLIYINSDPQYLSPYLNVEKITKDIALRKGLQRVHVETQAFLERLRDTLLQVSSEANTAVRLFYKSVKAAAQEGFEGAETISKDLSYHFKKQGSGAEGDQVEPEKGNIVT